MTSFAPVFLPEFSRRLSVTFGRHENACSRAGFFYVKHRRSGASAHPLERGSALHRVLELGTLKAIEEHEPTIPPEVVKDIVNVVLADPRYRCPVEEHDYIREAAYRWAEEATFDPRSLIACETMFQLEVGGYTIRGVVDRGDILEGGKAVGLEDYKSARAMPSFEDIGRRRPDGSVAAKDYQLVLYALLVAFGVPVRVEEREGERVEVPDPFGVADQVERFDLAYVFPGIDVDGRMGRRGVSLSRLELHEYLASIEAQVARVDAAVRSGDWPATVGSHCNECPCRVECPVPAELRTFAGVVNSAAEAAEAASQLDREKALHAARAKELRNFVKTLPGQRLRFGRDQVMEPRTVVKTVIRDKDAMFEAVERARSFGEPFDRESFVQTQVSTPIAQRRLTEDELASEAATTSEGSS